jgi:hypothetical protein
VCTYRLLAGLFQHFDYRKARLPMRKTLSALACLAALCVTLGARADIVTDSATFDRAYIPALALTNQGDAEGSRVAMTQLNRAWRVYENAHREDYPGDNTWKAGFVEIGKRIAEAGTIVERGTRLADAHEALERVRVILMQLRRKHGVDYFLDYQTAFHEPMEEIVLAAKGKTPATLMPRDLAKIRDTIPTLEARWNAVRNARFVPADFGFDSARAAKMNHFLALETDAIAALKGALVGADKTAVIQRAVALKPPFAQLYMLFGESPR